jgi:hypothetical protein
MTMNMKTTHETRRPSPTTSLLAVLVLLLAGTPSVLGQEVVFATVSPLGGHDLVAVDDVSLDARLVYASARLLALDLEGFALRDRLRHDLPRQGGVDTELSYVRLPSLGSLYRYTLGAPAVTHLSLNGADGIFRNLLEIPNIAGAASINAKITTDSDGLRALVSTPEAAGGNVLLVDLTGVDPVLDLTSQLPPMQVDESSLRLSSDRAWFLSNNTLYRAPLAAGLPSNDAQAVSMPIPASDTIHAETLLSWDGSVLVVVTENPIGQRSIFSLTPTGTAQLLTPPGIYDLPGLESPIGPLLALSQDGSRMAYRARLLGDRELLLRKVGPASTVEQVTRDALFTDTLDNVGILGFVGGGRLVFAAGEGIATGPAAHIEGADLFMVDASGPSLAPPINITGTSGFNTPPFNDYGTLDIKSAAVDPSNERLLMVVDPAGGDFALAAAPITGQPGFETLISRLQAAPTLAPAGESVLILSLPSPPSAFSQQAHLLGPASSTPPVLKFLTGTAGPTLSFARFAVNRAGTQAAFVASLGLGLELPAIVDVAARRLEPVWSELLTVSAGIAFTPTGRLAVGLGNPGASHIYVGFNGAFAGGVVYPIHPGEGFPLDY